MAKFAVSVSGSNYEVEAPDERTAWKWANATHLQAVKNDPQQAPRQAVPAGLETAGQSVSSQIRPYLPTERGTDVAAEISKAPYELGARVNDAAAKALPAPFAAGLGAAANAGMEGMGVLAGGAIGGAAGALAKEPLKDTARWTMQKALKPSTPDFRKGKADRAIETLLEEGVNVSRGGVEKLRGIGEGLNRQVTAELVGSTATIPKAAPPARILDAINKVEDVNPLPSGPRTAMEGVYNEFMSNPLVPANIPLTKAQSYKQTLQQGLKDKYGTLSDGEEAARKALAMGLREEIERGAPAVGPLNKRASDIWNALNVTERRALVGGNNNPVSLPTAVGMLHNPAFGAGMIVNTSDLAKSLIARGLYQSGKAAPYLGAGAGMAATLTDNGD